MNKIRVIVVDDHKIMLAGLKLVINSQTDMEVVAEAQTAAQALDRIDLYPCDIVLLDLTMPGGGSLRLVETLSARTSAPRVLVLTMHDDPVYARAALGAGATGYVVKTIGTEDLIAAMHAVHRGQMIVNLDDDERTSQVFGAVDQRGMKGSSPLIFKLSTREVEVLHLLGQGYTNQAVAEQLDISPKTVATYRARIAEKFGLKTTVDFVKYAANTGLLGIAGEHR